jgi:hypothetical protein
MHQDLQSRRRDESGTMAHLGPYFDLTPTRENLVRYRARTNATHPFSLVLQLLLELWLLHDLRVWQMRGAALERRADTKMCQASPIKTFTVGEGPWYPKPQLGAVFLCFTSLSLWQLFSSIYLLNRLY